MDYYEKMIFKFAKRYNSKKKYPAAVVCARLNAEVSINKSGAVPDPLAFQLENNLSVIGKIGSKNKGGNFIGRCAEVRSSNPILLNHSTNRAEQITFTKSYRPRTMQVIPLCNNCRQTFNHALPNKFTTYKRH